MNDIEQTFISVLEKELTVATGCTDPVSISLAASTARYYLIGEVKRVDIIVSANIYKNAISVGIPGTNKKGLHYAAALGIISGDHTKGLEVLNGVTKESERLASLLLEKAEFNVAISHEVNPLFVKVILTSDKEYVEVVIEEDYDQITEINKNGDTIYRSNYSKLREVNSVLDNMDIKNIIEFAENVDLSKILFLKEAAEMNKNAVLAGLKYSPGFKLGYTLNLNETKTGNIMLDSFLRAKIYTAAAADARMSGMEIPIMSVAGSGNHGITSILSVLAVWEEEGLPEEKLIRSLSISCLITIYIKTFIKRMTAFCGCGVAAATGATAAITWLLGGDVKQIINSMQSIIGSLTGMICDGAKESCAFKVSIAAGEAVLNAYLSLKGSYVQNSVGIVGEKSKDSLINLGHINDPGMKETDRIILEIVRSIQGE